MALVPGSRLGPYEILAPLGAGGMGEVYRARDSRLGRDVAVKVLPESRRSDPERLRRFEQEARAASALNHPSLLAVLDVGAHDGAPYVVSELLEGETLRERLRVGGLTPTKAVEYAVQIALGLSAAHEKGITHRDLKPENLFLTRDGRVKILDFGLAKLREPRPDGDGGPEGETLSHDTEPGAILGTVGYMSPEQVRGRPADHRSDIFSFGAVLYEMLSRRRAFLGDSSPEVLTAILKEDPPELASSERNLPPALGRVVRRCLEKRPEDRFHSAHDLALALEAISTSPEGVRADAQPDRRPAAVSRPWMVVATTLVALLALMTWLSLWPTGVDLSRYRFTPLATDAEMEEEGAWSPDGRSIAYLKVLLGREQIFVRSVDADSPVQVTRGSNGAESPFWSPDSSRIWFLSAGGIWSVGRAGGEPELVRKEEVDAAALSPDGRTLATWRTTTRGSTTTGSVWLSSPPTAEPREYTPAPFAVSGPWNPQFLRFSPDGRQVLVAFDSANGVAVWLLPFPDGPGARNKPRPIFTTNPPWRGTPGFSWMPDSRHVVMAFKDAAGTPSRLWMADTRTETLLPLTASVTDEAQPDVSPDGSRIVFTSGWVDHDLVEVPLDGSAPSNLLATSRNEHSAAWVPGAARFVYMTDRSGQVEIRIRSRTEDWDRVVVSARDFPSDATSLLRAPVVSPDGGQLAYDRRSGGGHVAIWLSPVTGGAPARLTQVAMEHFSPAWSPDGKWLAFHLWDGRVEKLARSRVGSSEAPQTLVEDDVESAIPAWSPRGEWIAYASAEGVNLVEPDGKARRLVAKVQFHGQPALLWSRDGAWIYTVALEENGGAQLVSVDVRSGAVRRIGSYGPGVRFGTPSPPGLRFTLGPDGRSFLATVRRFPMDLWLLEGFDARKGLLDLFRRPARS
ncbi:MAG TPA: protein kinase [Vicinamibacteria bacterium]|nr:protein kinase [Vicinamibacteria bacterium]